MTFVEYVNGAMRRAAAQRKGLVVYGQNVSTGSCLSGLSRGFDAIPDCTVINVPNSENTLTGMGFGMILQGVDCVLFLKQQDFLLLGMDHLVNTWNALRHREHLAAFAIVAIVVDNGWEGPQSCLNNLDDFCSLARISGHVISNRYDADEAIARHMFKPGPKLIGISQRLFRAPPLDVAGSVPEAADDCLMRYRTGRDVTLVSCNFAFPQALALTTALERDGLNAALWSVAGLPVRDWSPLIADVARTNRLVVIDDSKSVNRTSRALVLAIREALPEARVVIADRDDRTEERSAPNADVLNLDTRAIFDSLRDGT